MQQAQLLVNGEVAQEVPPNNLSNFSADISNFVFGANTVQVAIADEQGLQARSPAITLTVLQGEEQIPEELAPSIPVLRILLYCLIALFNFSIQAQNSIAGRKMIVVTPLVTNIHQQ